MSTSKRRRLLRFRANIGAGVDIRFDERRGGANRITIRNGSMWIAFHVVKPVDIHFLGNCYITPDRP